MRILLVLCVAFLTACSPNLTVNSAPINPTLLQSCGDKIADPLTTGDQYDTGRALGQAIEYGKNCKASKDELIAAVKAREQLYSTMSKQLER